MTTTTHCIPGGTPFPSWGMPVSNVSDALIGTTDPGAGNRRGIIVFCHPTLSEPLTLMPPPIPSTTVASDIQNFANDRVADGWVFQYPTLPCDFVSPAMYSATFADSSAGNIWFYWCTKNDPGNGTFVVSTIAEWWDHYLLYLQNKYGANRPIVIVGYSLGAWHAAQIVKNRSSSVVGSILHCLPTLWENIAGWPSVITWTGQDLSTTFYNGVTSLPIIIGYSNNDAIVGWDPAGTGGTPASNTTSIIANAGSNVTGYQQGPMNVTGVSGNGTTVTFTVTSLATGFGSSELVWIPSGTFSGTFAGLNGTSQTCTATGSNTFSIANATTGTSTGLSATVYGGQDHLFYSPDTTVYNSWFSSTIDPHYPVSF